MRAAFGDNHELVHVSHEHLLDSLEYLRLRLESGPIDVRYDGGVNRGKGTIIDYSAQANGFMIEVKPNVVRCTYQSSGGGRPLPAQRIRVTPEGIFPADSAVALTPARYNTCLATGHIEQETHHRRNRIESCCGAHLAPGDTDRMHLCDDARPRAGIHAVTTRRRLSVEMSRRPVD